MERASIETKTPTGKCLEKEVFWSKVVQKTVVKIHLRDLKVANLLLRARFHETRSELKSV